MTPAVREIQATQLEKWSSLPNFNGGMRVGQNFVEVLSEDASKVQRYPIDKKGALGTASTRGRWDRVDAYFENILGVEKKIKAPSSEIRLTQDGEFLLELSRGPVETLWKLSLGMPLYGMQVFAKGSRPIFTAWSSHPATVVKFDWGLRQDGGQAVLLKAAWDSGSEILSFEHCSQTQLVLSERLPNGLVQLNFFSSRRPENLELVSYAKLNVSGNMRPEEISSIRHKNCEDFYLAGTFGVMRARFNLAEAFR